MVTGRTFECEEAREMGLVNAIFEAEGFRDQVKEYARKFAPPNKAAKAVGHIKRCVQSGLEASFGDGLAIERELQQLLFQSEDAKEGISAYTEKRTAKFTGN